MGPRTLFARPPHCNPLFELFRPFFRIESQTAPIGERPYHPGQVQRCNRHGLLLIFAPSDGVNSRRIPPTLFGWPQMKLLFALFNYFPHGGQQRNCLRIAQKCAQAGHDVTIAPRTWEGPRPDEVAVETLGLRGWTNAGRNQNFITDLANFVAGQDFDGVIAFTKMPGLDVYFASDPCFAAKYRQTKSRLGKLTRRYRLYRKWEEAVFAKGSRTQILLITDREVPLYREIYGTEPERFHLLPPNIDRRTFSESDRESARLAKRAELGPAAAPPRRLGGGEPRAGIAPSRAWPSCNRPKVTRHNSSWSATANRIATSAWPDRLVAGIACTCSAAERMYPSGCLPPICSSTPPATKTPGQFYSRPWPSACLCW